MAQFFCHEKLKVYQKGMGFAAMLTSLAKAAGHDRLKLTLGYSIARE